MGRLWDVLHQYHLDKLGYLHISLVPGVQREECQTLSWLGRLAGGSRCRWGCLLGKGNEEWFHLHCGGCFFSLFNAILLIYCFFKWTLTTTVMIKYVQQFRVSKELLLLLDLLGSYSNRFLTLKSLDESIHGPLKITLICMLHDISFTYHLNNILILFLALPLAGECKVLWDPHVKGMF